ncbi:MAG: S8 family serine peptidase [Caldilinea sp.]|nr:S8 family serine peptidase [Caldilinea sp.]
MSEKTIIAHFMHEYEEAAAGAAMTQTERAQGYYVGQIDEALIPVLEAQGVIVQVLEEVRSSPAAMVESVPSGAAFEVAKGIEESDYVAATTDFYIVEFSGPVLKSRRDELQAFGVALLEQLAPSRYTARLNVSQVRAVQQLSYVRGVRLYKETVSGAAMPKGVLADAQPEQAVPQRIIYDVRLHRAQDRAFVLDWLEANQVAVVAAGGRKVRVYLFEGSLLRSDLARLPEVAVVERYVAPELCNDLARQLLGIDSVSSATPTVPYTGTGEVVGVADTGLDEMHPDFQGRVVGVRARGRPGDASDPNGHGTHVAGSVAGDGAASAGAIRGTAPAAQLYFQSILTHDGTLGGLPADLNELFEEAYQAGVRVHNNSWASRTASRYTNHSIEVDEFVQSHKDRLVVIAAGNEGKASASLHSQPGFVDWLSIGSPGSSKNGLTVGASRSNRQSGGYAQYTWKQFKPGHFPQAPIADEKVSGDPEALAAFSSRGPCDDRRIKPDLVAPGTDILSARSSTAPDGNFWGLYAANPRYAFLGGTSMAAPLVSGCAALVREYYRTQRGHMPSAALLKATLLNGARSLTAADALADHGDLPNYHQGFGFLYMPWVLPNPGVAFELQFLDTWQTPVQQLPDSGSRIRIQFSISGGVWLRICLPGRNGWGTATCLAA